MIKSSVARIYDTFCDANAKNRGMHRRRSVQFHPSVPARKSSSFSSIISIIIVLVEPLSLSPRAKESLGTHAYISSSRQFNSSKCIFRGCFFSCRFSAWLGHFKANLVEEYLWISAEIPYGVATIKIRGFGTTMILQ